jgi:hypothetical protein
MAQRAQYTEHSDASEDVGCNRKLRAARGSAMTRAIVSFVTYIIAACLMVAVWAWVVGL